MEQKNNIALEAGKHLIKGLIILQFKPDEIKEIIDMLDEEKDVLAMLKWFKQELPNILKLMESDSLEEVKGMVFQKASSFGGNKEVI